MRVITGAILDRHGLTRPHLVRDLRGALYTGVVNATAYLAFTLNPTPVVISGDATLAVWSQTAATGANATRTNVTWTVYQNYIDQLPRYQSGKNAGSPILPPIAMRTQYRLVNTSLSAISARRACSIRSSLCAH